MESADVARIVPVSRHAVVLALLLESIVWKLVYPSSEIAANVGFVSPFAYLTAQSFTTVAIVFVAADARAFLLMLVKDGIAIAERIASTTLSLPVHEFINEKHIRHMASLINNFYK